MSKFETLERLSALRASGALTEEEFSREKSKLLDDEAQPIGKPMSWWIRGGVVFGSCCAGIGLLVFGVTHASFVPPMVKAPNPPASRIAPDHAPGESSLKTGTTGAPEQAIDWKSGWQSDNFSVRADTNERICSLTILSDDGKDKIVILKQNGRADQYYTSVKVNVPTGTRVNLILRTVFGSGVGEGSADGSAKITGNAIEGGVAGTATKDLVDTIRGGDWTSGFMDYDGDTTATAGANYSLLGADAAFKKLIKCSSSLEL